MNAELKWTKVSSQKIKEYKTFLDYFFALINTDNIHFHCIIIDNHKVNHRVFNKGNKEIGFYKFYYQLLLHKFGKAYCKNKSKDKIIVHLDQRNSKYSLNDLKDILNKGIKKKCNIFTNPFVSIEPIDSKKSEILQIADIVLGAVGFQKNGYDLLAHSKQGKKDLVNYIIEKSGLNNLCDTTPYSDKRFTIWNFKLS